MISQAERIVSDIGMGKLELPVNDLHVIKDMLAVKRRKLWQVAEKKVVGELMRNLSERCKEKQLYPILPSCISRYYDDRDDKAISIIIACLCLTTNVGKDDRMMEQVRNLRMVLGEHPYKDFFLGRRFVLLSTGENQQQQIGDWASMKYWQLSSVVAKLFDVQEEASRPLEWVVRKSIVFDGKSPLVAFRGIVDSRYVKNVDYRASLALASLYGTDGAGCGLWAFGDIDKSLPVAVDSGMKKFLEALLPNYGRWNITAEDISDALGMERTTDVWYAYYGFRKLAVADPDGCRLFMRRYHAQLKNGTTGAMSRYFLKRITPKIPF